ncbi:MAG: OsmC family protein [Saprospiraceae bacterium]
MTANVTYTGSLRTEATHLRSGNKIITDAPVDNQGKGEAFSPTDLMATSLASCVLTIMGIAARNHGINMVGTTASVNKIMARDPRRIARLEINIAMPTEIDYSKKQQKILEAAAHGCPVGLSIHPELEEVIVFKW